MISLPSKFDQTLIMDLELGKFILQAAISVAGAFLAAHLAMKKFRSEKWWEKKVSAYIELIDALHLMKLSASEYMLAMKKNTTISQKEKQQMLEKFKLSRQNVLRIADSSSFLMPKEINEIVQEMEDDLIKVQDNDDWWLYLIEEYEAIQKCMQRIKEIGRIDLSI